MWGITLLSRWAHRSNGVGSYTFLIWNRSHSTGGLGKRECSSWNRTRRQQKSMKHTVRLLRSEFQQSKSCTSQRKIKEIQISAVRLDLAHWQQAEGEAGEPGRGQLRARTQLRVPTLESLCLRRGCVEAGVRRNRWGGGGLGSCHRREVLQLSSGVFERSNAVEGIGDVGELGQ